MVIAVTLISLVLLVHGVSYVVVLDSFENLEQIDINRNVEQAKGTLYNDMISLDTINGDWANWNETYVYMQDSNPVYIENNLQNTTFTLLDVNLLLYVNNSGMITHGKAYDLNNDTATEIPESLLDHINKESPLLQRSEHDNLTGILLLPEGPMLISAKPIMTTEMKGPVQGTLIMGRYLDEKRTARLSDISHMPITIFRMDDERLPEDVKEAKASLQSNGSSIISPVNQSTIDGYGMISDIYGTNGILLKIEMPRSTYNYGKNTIAYFTAAMVLIGAAISVIVIVLLNKLVISRVTRLHKSVQKIGRNSDLSTRVPVEGNDEISDLAKAINSMISSIEESRQKLMESEARYRAVVEDQTELICRFKADGTITFVNDAYCRYFGKNRDEIIDQEFISGLPGVYKMNDELSLSTLTPVDPQVTIEDIVVLPGEETRWNQWTYRALYDKNNRLIEYQAVGHDITELKNAEEALMKANKLLKQSVDDRNLELEIVHESLRKELAEHIIIDEKQSQ